MNTSSQIHPLLRIFRWLFSWRILRRGLFVLVCLTTLLALVITEENWRGRRDWENFKRQWEAKGERFDLASVLPAPLSDDQNFAKAPILAGAFNVKPDPNTGDLKPVDPSIPDRLNVSIYGRDIKIPSPATGSRHKGTRIGLALWQQYYRALATNSAAAQESGQSKAKDDFPIPAQAGTPAADVLLALSKDQAVMEELTQAAMRPGSRFPINYEDGFAAASVSISPLGKFKSCGQWLRLHAVAELAAGESDLALGDVELSLRLLEAVRGEPFLIDHLVGVALFELVLDPIWEGQACHIWSDAQLVALGKALQDLDFLADYGRVMRGERAFAVWTMDAMSYFGPFMPSGWRYQNQMAICRMQLNWVLPLMDLDRRLVSPERARQIAADFKSSQRFTMYNLFAVNLYPALASANERFARSQSSLDLARAACALERYRLAHGQYPETLDALVPQFIEKVPHDLINGQPLKYRKDSGGQFDLYSVGWNEKDDGGTLGLKKDGGVDWEQGDWVWRCP